MAERRRLPILQKDPPPPGPTEPDAADAADEHRPPLHWVGFGTVAIFAAWLPLTYLAGALSRRVLASRFGADASQDAVTLAMNAMSSGERARLMATVALPGVFALALAAFGGGVVVGRFGSGTGAREAAYAGAATAFIATIMAWSAATLSSLLGGAVTLAVAVAFAAWGGRFGASKRPPATPATPAT